MDIFMIYIFLAEGFEEIEALTPLDILRRARLDVKTVSISDNLIVRGAHGIDIAADEIYRNISISDITLAVFPGGMPGAKNLDEWEACDKVIEATIANNARLAAICAAPMILGKRGLLTDKKAVCYPGFEAELKGANILYSPFVTDGNITTARGMGAALDFSLELVNLLKGKECAEKIKTGIIKE